MFITALHRRRLHKIIRDGLVGWWRFDEGSGTATADASGEGNDGTLVNMEAGDWVSGLHGSGYALDLDGANEYINFGNDSSLDIDTGSVTVMAWVIIPSGASTGALFDKCYKGVTAANGGYTLYYRTSDPYLRMAVQDNTVNYAHQATAATDIRDGVKHHVAGRWDASTKKVSSFVDGVKQGETYSGSMGSMDEANNYPLYIGARYNMGSPDLHAEVIIDGARVYNRAVPDAEIAAIAAGLG